MLPSNRHEPLYGSLLALLSRQQPQIVPDVVNFAPYAPKRRLEDSRGIESQKWIKITQVEYGRGYLQDHQVGNGEIHVEDIKFFPPDEAIGQRQKMFGRRML